MQPKKRLVYIEHDQGAMNEVFIQAGWKPTLNLEEASAVVLIGGADIDHSWYSKHKHRRTGGSMIRDHETNWLYEHAVENDKLLIGICRGAQFINAKQGGGMYQDVGGHTNGNHLLWDVATESYHRTNSIHHQMIIPTDKAVCIAFACQASVLKEVGDESFEQFVPVCHYRETVTEDGETVSVPVTEDAPEWEVVYYPEVKGLCFQGHPEYDRSNGACREYFLSLLERIYE